MSGGVQFGRKGLVHGPIHAEPLLELVRSGSVRTATFGGHEVSLRGRSDNVKYLRVFAQKGTACQGCSRVGTEVYVEKSDSGSVHLALFAVRKTRRGGRVLVRMTKDHIKARADGGDSHISNLQPMCAPCNGKKGSEYDRRTRVFQMVTAEWHRIWWQHDRGLRQAA